MGNGSLILSSTSGGGGGGALALAFSGTTGAFEIAYTGGLIATGGAGGYVYSISAGALPGGLTLNASTGAITGNPSVIGTFNFTGKVVDSASNIKTGNYTITISVMPTPGSTVGDEWGNPTISSVAVVYSVNAGVEQYQIFADGTASPGSSFPAFGQGQGVLCSTALLAVSIPSWSSSAAVNITVKPWTVTRTCTTNGTSTITSINPPVSPGAANVAINGFVLVGTQAYSVASWYADGTGCVLSAEIPSGSTWPSTGTGVSFATLEYRYGGIGNGHLLWINGYEFTLNTLSQNLSATGESTWNVTPVATSGPGVTSGVYILDIEVNTNGCDEYAGTMPLGTTTAVSPTYNIGAPAAYVYLLVGENVYGQMNTWPVLGETPGVSGTFVVGVEYQQPSTITTLLIPPGTSDSGNLVINGSFEFTTYGVTGGVTTTTLVPSTWSPQVTNYLNGRGILDPTKALSDRLFNSVGGSSSQYTSGNLVLKFIANSYEVVSNFTSCIDGQQFTASFAACGDSGVPQITIGLGFFAADGVTFISAVTANETVGTSWASYTLTGTVPSGASYVYVAIETLAGGTINSGNAIWIDNITLDSIITQGQIGAGAVGTAQLTAAAVTASKTALAALSSASGELATDAVYLASQMASGVVLNQPLYAASLVADSSVIGSMITGSLVITLGLTAGGSIVSAQGNSYVGINALGNAFVASNTTTGATTVLDDGYLNTFGTAGFDGSHTSATYDATMGFVGYEAVPLELSLTAVQGSTTLGSFDVTVGQGEVVLFLNTYVSNPISLVSSPSSGVYIELGASSVVPSAGQGTLYYDGTHLYFCLTSGTFTTIV